MIAEGLPQYRIQPQNFGKDIGGQKALVTKDGRIHKGGSSWWLGS